MRQLFIFLFILSFITSIRVSAQNPASGADTSSSRIQILNAAELSYEKRNDLVVQKLIGNVRLKQDSTLFFCDRAYNYELENRLEAYGNVKVIMSDSLQLEGDKLIYDASSRVAEVFDNIILTDGKVTLYTDHLTYYRNEAYGEYLEGGKLVDTTNTLTSISGLYFPGQKMAYFKEDVLLESPDYDLETDTLGYNTELRIASFLAPTIIKGEKGEIFTSLGTYNSELRVIDLDSRSTVKDSTYILTADSLDYDDNQNFGIAVGDVIVEQTDSTLKILGNYGQFNRAISETIITDDAVAIQYFEGDTLFMFADTLYTIEDSMGQRNFRAYNEVSFFMNDMQGSSDSLVYQYSDSIIYLYYDPIIWADENQLTGDTIIILMENNEADSMWVGKNGFLVSQEDTIGYNQIKGKEIRANFDQNQLVKMHVIGNSESIYFSQNELGTYEGMNQALAQEMLIYLKDNQAEKIVFLANPEGKYYPIFEILFQENKLEGMQWRINERPSRPPLDETGIPHPRKPVFQYVPSSNSQESGIEKEVEIKDTDTASDKFKDQSELPLQKPPKN